MTAVEPFPWMPGLPELEAYHAGMTDPAGVDFMSPLFVALRAKAAAKPNTYGPTTRVQIGEQAVVDAVRADGRFEAIVQALGAGWSDVFRDLLRARARGLIELVGEDRWDDVDGALIFEVCDTLAEAKREAPIYGDGCCVFELQEDKPPVFVWQHGSDGWLTARQMANVWGTRTRRVVGYIVKLGLLDSKTHARGDGRVREYSPAAQSLIEREWRSYGRPA